MSFEMAKAPRKGLLFVKSRQGHVQAQESGIFLAMTVEQNGVQISQPKMLVENSETGFEPGRTLLRSTRALRPSWPPSIGMIERHTPKESQRSWPRL